MVLFTLMLFQFQELEELGFYGFSIGFCGSKMELVGTRKTLSCFDAELIEYLHAKIIAGTQ